MWTFERYTESRGRSAVPTTLRLTRLRRFSRCNRFCWTTDILYLLAGLADLAPDLLVAVADALALVGLRRPYATDLRGHLADALLVYPAHDDGRRVGDLELDALARLDQDGVREPYLQVHVAPLQRGPVADARDLERLREPLGDAGNGVLDEAPGEPVHRLVVRGVGGPVDDEDLLGPRALLREVAYVALLLEDAGYVSLHLGVGDLGPLVLRHLRVADPGEEIRYGIVNRHRSLPTRFRYPGDLALVGELPEADPAQPELPVVPVRPAAPLAPVVLPDPELLLLLLLYQQSFSRHYLSTPPEGHPEQPQEL